MHRLQVLTDRYIAEGLTPADGGHVPERNCELTYARIGAGVRWQSSLQTVLGASRPSGRPPARPSITDIATSYAVIGPTRGSDMRDVSNDTFWLLAWITFIVYCAVFFIGKKLDEIGNRIVWAVSTPEERERFKRPPANSSGTDEGDALLCSASDCSCGRCHLVDAATHPCIATAH